MFDPSKYKISESAVAEVKDADGNVIYLDDAEETPWTITIASPGTKKAMAALHKAKKAGEADVLLQMKGKKSKRDENSSTATRAEFLMAIVESTNAENLTYEGATGMDALRAIFEDPFMAHIAADLEAFHLDRGNFVTDSSTISSNTSAT